MMRFKAYIAANNIDIDVAQANGTLMDWYGSLEELYDDYGVNAEYVEIELEDFEIILDDLSIMRFEDIKEN